MYNGASIDIIDSVTESIISIVPDIVAMQSVRVCIIAVLEQIEHGQSQQDHSKYALSHASIALSCTMTIQSSQLRMCATVFICAPLSKEIIIAHDTSLASSNQLST